MADNSACFKKNSLVLKPEPKQEEAGLCRWLSTTSKMSINDKTCLMAPPVLGPSLGIANVWLETYPVPFPGDREERWAFQDRDVAWKPSHQRGLGPVVAQGGASGSHKKALSNIPRGWIFQITVVLTYLSEQTEREKSCTSNNAQVLCKKWMYKHVLSRVLLSPRRQKPEQRGGVYAQQPGLWICEGRATWIFIFPDNT